MLMKHFLKISHKLTILLKRTVMEILLKFHPIAVVHPLFTHSMAIQLLTHPSHTDIGNAIKTFKNSHATNFSNILNFIIKHFGSVAVQILKDIYNYNCSWLTKPQTLRSVSLGC